MIGLSWDLSNTQYGLDISHRTSGGSLLLLIVISIVGYCNCSMFCWELLYVHSSFAITLMGKRELVYLLSLSSWCLVIVVWLFLAVPWVCLLFVIVVFPDHTIFQRNDPRTIPSQSCSKISIPCRILVAVAAKMKNLKNLLNKNYWADFKRIRYQCSLGDPQPNMFERKVCRI